MPEIRKKRKPRLQDGVFTLYYVPRCRNLTNSGNPHPSDKRFFYVQNLERFPAIRNRFKHSMSGGRRIQYPKGE